MRNVKLAIKLLRRYNERERTLAMSLKSLIATGTKLWLDSIDPELVKKNFAMGVSGATSNPIIIPDIGGLLKNPLGIGQAQQPGQQGQQGLGGVLGGIFGKKKK